MARMVRDVMDMDNANDPRNLEGPVHARHHSLGSPATSLGAPLTVGVPPMAAATATMASVCAIQVSQGMNAKSQCGVLRAPSTPLRPIGIPSGTPQAGSHARLANFSMASSVDLAMHCPV